MPAVDSDQIHQIIRTHARIKPDIIERDHVLTRDLGFDSLAFLLAVSDLEDRVGFTFPLERVEELSQITVGELLALVSRGEPCPS